MRIFIIGGKAEVGKNHLAKMIKEYYQEKGKKTIITEYSKYIKLFAMEMLHWHGEREDKPRKFLQDMGENIRLTLGQDVLIKRMMQDILIYQKYCDVLVICDARLIAEYELIKDKYNDVHTIYLYSDIPNELTISERQHPTEHALDNYQKVDYRLDGTDLNGLNIEIIKILEELK